MKKVWAILIWGVLVFAIGTYLDKVRELLMVGGDQNLTYVLRFGIGFVLVVVVALVGRWLKRWLGRNGLGPGDWFMIGAVAWVIEGGYGWVIDPRATLDIQVHDTMFIIGRLHAIGGAAILYGVIGAIYYLGRGMNSVLGFIHFFVTHSTLYVLFWMKNFDPAYSVKGYLDYREFQNYKIVSGGYEVMAIMLVAAQLLFVVNLVVVQTCTKLYRE
jgi:heme/copper-type cytochrome/quinol oxidase subunit 1